MTQAFPFKLTRQTDREFYWDMETTPWTLYSRETPADSWVAVIGGDQPDGGLNTQTGTAYTLALTDANDIVEMNNASANELTIPAEADVDFPIGSLVSVTMYGAGTTTITADAGVTLNGVEGGSGAISEQYAGVSLYKRASDEWIMQGSHGGVA